MRLGEGGEGGVVRGVSEQSGSDKVMIMNEMGKLRRVNGVGVVRRGRDKQRRMCLTFCNASCIVVYTVNFLS